MTAAHQPDTSEAQLGPLAADDDPDVRWSVATNPWAPATVLELLATDEDTGVRYAVAEQRNTPGSALALLAADEDKGVRFVVTWNPNTREATLKRYRSADLPPAVIARVLATSAGGVRHLAEGLVDGWEGTLAELLDTARLLDVTDQIDRAAPLQPDRATVRRRKPQVGMTFGL